MPWTPTPKVREELRVAGMGLSGENFSRIADSSSAIMISGTIYAMLVGLKAGDVVTNVVVEVQTVGAGMTLSKVGIYDTTGTRLATSADLTTSWQNLGDRVGALITPYSVTTTGGYYLAAFGTTATTMPTLERGSNSGTHTAIGSGALAYCCQTGQADLIASATLVNTNALGFWIGWN